MANGNDNGAGKLLVGGALAFLAWNWLKQGGLNGGGACPPNAVQVRMADGSVQCVPASNITGLPGGLSVGQLVQLIGGIVGTLVGIGAQVAALIAKAASSAGAAGSGVTGAGAAGAGATTATTATTTTTSTVATTTADAGDIATEAISVGIDTSFATGLGLMAILYAVAELTVNIAQWIGNVARARARADRQAPTNFDTILYNEQAGFASFASGLSDKLNATIQQTAAAAGTTPTYPDLNQQQAVALNGFALRGFGGLVASPRARGEARLGRFGRFGAGLVATKTGAGITASGAALRTKLTPQQSQLLAAIAASGGLATTTPYSYTEDSYVGGQNELGAVIAQCANGPCYYMTSIDARLPVGMLRDYRGLMRWVFWTVERAYNNAMHGYWAWRSVAEGGLADCAQLGPAAANNLTTCLATLTKDPDAFDDAATAYYRSIPPSQLLPEGFQTFTTYPELNALAYEYITNLNALAAKANVAPIDFQGLVSTLEFNGTAQALCQAGQIGFGTFLSTWPGDCQFTEMVRMGVADAWSHAGPGGQPGGTTDANCAGRQPVAALNSAGQAGILWLIQDPVTGWLVDVIGSRNLGVPQCYQLHSALTPPYRPLGRFGEGQARRRRSYGAGIVAVPLDPPMRRAGPFGGLFEALARGLRT